MSTMQRLTLIGLYNYDSTLFDGLTLPEEYDKNVFIDSLLLEHGEKCVLYSNPEFMKYSIGAWGRKWSMELERIAEALQAEYNPIYNYDRFEKWTETDKPDVTTTRTHDNTDTQTLNNSTTRTHDNTDTQTLDNSTTRTHNDTDTRTNDNTDTTTNNNTDTQTNRYDVVTEQNTDGNVEHQVSADNSSSYQPERKDITNNGKTTQSNDGTITNAHTGTITDAHTGTITDAHTGTITDANSGTITDAHTGTITDANSGTITDAHTGTITDANSGTITDAHTGTITDREAGTRANVEHDGHLYGNIGITTSAAMVSEVIAQRYRYNLYGTAARIFANELLIGIY